MSFCFKPRRVSGRLVGPSVSLAPTPAAMPFSVHDVLRGPADCRDGDAAPPVRAAIVVDDDELTAMVIAEHCRSIGVDVSEAYDPFVALDLLVQRNDVAAIISDVRMPGMSGPEMVRRALAIRPALAVVYVTGYAAEEVAGALEPWPVLRKPFNLAELGPALRRATKLS